MAAPKGNKFSTGRPPGSKNQKTEEWEALGRALLERHSKRANDIMNSAPDEKFMDYFGRLVEYFRPKLNRSTVSQEGTSEIDLYIHYPDADRHNDSPPAPEADGVTG